MNTGGVSFVVEETTYELGFQLFDFFLFLADFDVCCFDDDVLLFDLLGVLILQCVLNCSEDEQLASLTVS